jgi:hypothetical protein
MGADVFSRPFVVILLVGVILGGNAAAQTSASPDSPARGQAQPGGWEFTRWGMPLVEMIQSSNGRAQPIDDEAAAKFASCFRTTYRCRAYIPEYRAGSLHFDVLFGFDKRDLLMLVAMETEGAEHFQVLEKQFTSALGKPVGIQDGAIRIRTWDHVQRGNTISIRSEADLVVISYTPLRASSL